MKTKKLFHSKAFRFVVFASVNMVLLVAIKYAIDRSNIRNHILQTIQAGIAPEKLLEFKFSFQESKNLKWKNDNEFELDGEMYDIVSSVKHKTQIVYTCFHDTKETKYRRRFYSLLAKWILPDGDRESNDSNGKKLSKIYYCQEVQVLYLEFNETYLKGVVDLLLNNYKSIESRPNSPPPQL